MKKECLSCGEQLPLGAFGKCAKNEKRGTHHGRNQRCKPCARMHNRSSRYNVPVEDIIKLVEIDNCQICDKKLSGKEKNIDHSHETGKLRGILCLQCNTGIGSFYDNIDYLLNAIKYLNETNT